MSARARPSAAIAEGFDIVSITQKDGTVSAGTLLSESDVDVVVVDYTGSKHYVLKKDIQSRSAAKASAMPPMGGILKPGEVRDVIEFLVGLKE